jgi:hypothetical protein
MVKKTLVVVGILSLILMTAGTASAFRGCGPSWCAWPCGPAPYPFVPVDCPKYPVAKTIHQTWTCKIEGPCPGVEPAVSCGRGRRGFGLSSILGPLAIAIGTPFDFLFGGGPGIRGCRNYPGRLCGPNYGPVPKAAVFLPKLILAGPGGRGCFGTLW